MIAKIERIKEMKDSLGIIDMCRSLVNELESGDITSDEVRSDLNEMEEFVKDTPEYKEVYG